MCLAVHQEELDTVPCLRAVSGIVGAAVEQLQQKVGGGREELHLGSSQGIRELLTLSSGVQRQRTAGAACPEDSTRRHRTGRRAWVQECKCFPLVRTQDARQKACLHPDCLPEASLLRGSPEWGHLLCVAWFLKGNQNCFDDIT